VDVTPGRRIAAGLALLAVAAVAGLGACGIPMDDQPREITDREVRQLVQPTTTTTEPAPDGAVTHTVSYFFVRDGALAEVDAEVDTQPTIGEAVELLLDGPSERQAGDGLTTSVPQGTELLAARQRGGVVTLNLSSDMRNIGSTSEKEAYAQLAYTALGANGANRIHFEIDGKRVAPPTDRGNIETVTAGSYDPPLNPR
jgi:spore germination protein GerM